MSALVLSLFPGIGLLDRAFEAEGFCVVRGPDRLWGGDVRAFHPPAGRFEGVIGGPPCQPFSPLVHLVRANGREPKHGNLIPEFERVVAESACDWFLMEESPFAPIPQPFGGYTVTDFVLDNATLDAGDGLGEPQMRKRRFSFGWRRTGRPPDLRGWMAFAVLELPAPSLAVTGRQYARGTGMLGGSGVVKRSAVCASRPSPAAEGRGGNVWRDGGGRVKQRAVRGKNDSNLQPWEKQRAVKAAESGLAPGNHRRRSWAECCALQGVPAEFLDEAPFTVAGKFTVLGNGVPLSMGRAVAQAVKRAMGYTFCAR